MAASPLTHALTKKKKKTAWLRENRTDNSRRIRCLITCTDILLSKYKQVALANKERVTLKEIGRKYLRTVRK